METKEKLHKLRNIGFYFITDSNLTKLSSIKQVEIAIKEGVEVIQYREKFLDRRQMHETAVKIRKMTSEAGILFIVNDYVDVAIKAKADGVHLGQNDFAFEEARRIVPEEMMIGLTVSTVKQAIEAEKKGADYIAFGPIFKALNPKNKILGVDKIVKVKEKIDIPVVVFGGVNKNNVKKVIDVETDGYIIVSELFSKKDLNKEIKEVIKKK
ncbi:thiamine phosphate synthase [Candidatus Woesearchaeota archaeon]|jgi:thiamine-phosphate pyrophosphorylase|nr:thiamine phosphate synthase [Candidatus Woesearchaeota archaeon]MBT5272676.1 thiamine phosphate synthase [Candidatus Woesearchaeota archaeon]MBT6041283.1 thiamine phosphate synthase [Candidatus Woesearchaeota archaeon]MBT6337079.1 thiamine phosphate synthase [Candidatus Woesearchaeota archaeon]MBT7927867.1 thiamine phosphate synthase [Candidatus Woesearchaeota archaeon]